MRHLRKVNELLHSLHVGVASSILKQKTSGSLLEASQTSFSLRLNELDVLSYQPSLFNSESAYSIVYSFIGKSRYFQDLLEQDIKKARQYWNKEISGEFKSTLSAIQHAISNVSDRS